MSIILFHIKGVSIFKLPLSFSLCLSLCLPLPRTIKLFWSSDMVAHYASKLHSWLLIIIIFSQGGSASSSLFGIILIKKSSFRRSFWECALYFFQSWALLQCFLTWFNCDSLDPLVLHNFFPTKYGMFLYVWKKNYEILNLSMNIKCNGRHLCFLFCIYSYPPMCYSWEQTLCHTEILFAFLVVPIQATYSVHCSLLHFTTLAIQGELNKS